MEDKDDSGSSDLWTRRISNKPSVFMNKADRIDPREDGDSVSKRFSATVVSSSKSGTYNITTPSTSAVISPTTTGASSAFGLGSGAFASFGGGAKTPRIIGTAFDFGKSVQPEKSGHTSDVSTRRSQLSSKQSENFSLSRTDHGSNIALSSTPWPLKHGWVVHYRPPTGKHSDYEKSIMPLCKVDSAHDFWTVYSHLRRPSALPIVSDYHFFKEGIRPVWEDAENKHGGKWTMRVKKGVADRYWEDLLLAMIGDQFAEAGEEVCGAVISVRSGEDVFSIWTRNDGGRNIKIRETVKRVLSLPPDTNIAFRSHDESITQRNPSDHSRHEKSHGQNISSDKRKLVTNDVQPASRKAENSDRT